MHILQYIEAFAAFVGALGMLCSALSKVTSGKTSDVLAHLGTNFLAAAREAKSNSGGPGGSGTTHITIPKKDEP